MEKNQHMVITTDFEVDFDKRWKENVPTYDMQHDDVAQNWLVALYKLFKCYHVHAVIAIAAFRDDTSTDRVAVNSLQSSISRADASVCIIGLDVSKLDFCKPHIEIQIFMDDIKSQRS